MKIQIENRKSKIANGFTLVELLVVIAIIGVLAGFLFSVLKGVKKTQYIAHARAEMTQLETAIESYKNTYGFFPPDNGNTVSSLSSALTNQLYYELVGTTNTSLPNVSPIIFQMLDGSSTIDSSISTAAFSVGGFINCSKPGAGGENSPAAKNFILELKPGQTKTITVNSKDVTIFTTSVRGPDPDYQPVGQPDVNPWRYRYPGVENPNGYDLWVQLKIGGKTNLVCNWSTKVQVNNPLP